jgi:polyphenol oxidase
MIRRDCGPLVYYQFSNLEGFTEICHGIFTRHGGASAPPYHSLNVGMGVGDAAGAVASNREKIRTCLAAPELQAVRQVHGKQVRIWRQGASAGEAGGVAKADALVTNIEGKHLLIQVADCQPVFLYDPVVGVAANIHTGWRGSIWNVIGETIDAMKTHFGSRPNHVHAGVGPSLGPCCAEFIHYREELPEKFWKYRVSAHHFDFWEVSRRQLLEAGVPPGQIEISRMCTRCLASEFYSYRADRNTGRFAAVIGIRKESTE